MNVFRDWVVLRGTPQKIRWRSRARVVLPLDEGPDMPTIRALGRLDVGSVIVFGLEFVVRNWR